MDERPIGMFDSGFGGLTVARALIDLAPTEHVVYVGDTGRYPYGPRSLHEVRAFAGQISRWLIDEHDVKLIVVACNTASAAGLAALCATLPVPVVGVIDPGARALLKASVGDIVDLRTPAGREQIEVIAISYERPTAA